MDERASMCQRHQPHLTRCERVGSVAGGKVNFVFGSLLHDLFTGQEVEMLARTNPGAEISARHRELQQKEWIERAGQKGKDSLPVVQSLTRNACMTRFTSASRMQGPTDSQPPFGNLKCLPGKARVMEVRSVGASGDSIRYRGQL